MDATGVWWDDMGWPRPSTRGVKDICTPQLWTYLWRVTYLYTTAMRFLDPLYVPVAYTIYVPIDNLLALAKQKKKLISRGVV
jgi:hypothetical protein